MMLVDGLDALAMATYWLLVCSNRGCVIDILSSLILLAHLLRTEAIVKLFAMVGI